MGEIAFTDRELDIMGVLWEHGPATVAEVRERLTDSLAYTTVLTILRILEEKGYLGHKEEGRAHRYHVLVERKAAGSSALRRITNKLFRGSPELLLTERHARATLWTPSAIIMPLGPANEMAVRSR